MAVRGTSFYVQTEETDNGSYMTDLEVVHGKVAVWLYDENGNKKGDEVYVSEGYKVTIVIDPNESSENMPDVDGNAYFVYRTDDGGFIECKDIDPAPYKTDFSLMPDLVKQTALASDDSGLLKLDIEIEKILRGEEVTETTTTAPTETSETESSTETSEISETTPETTTVADETSASESSVVTELPAVTTDAPVPSETTIPQEAAPTESETTVPSVTTAPPETVTTTGTSETTTTTTTKTTTTTTTTTAEPEPEVATVLFADRSGNIVEQKEVEVGESIGALPAVPSVEGHTGKWTVDGEEISADYVVMGDVTVLAVYSINKYSVTFETKETGVTMPEAQTVEYGTKLSEALADDVEMPEKQTAIHGFIMIQIKH